MILYQSIVDSALFFAMVCWDGGIRAVEDSRLKLVRKARSQAGTGQSGVSGREEDEEQTSQEQVILDHPSP